MLPQARQRAARRSKLWAACVALGAAYGAGYGTVLGSFTAAPEGGPFLGALCGAVLGAIGGSVTGAVLLLVGDGLGWAPSAILAGLVPSLLLINLATTLARLTAHDAQGLELALGFGVLIPAVITIFLGCAIARALGSGRSGVPGVTKFVGVIDEVRGQQRAGGTGLPGEVTPAPAPTGRGSEAAPSLAAVTNGQTVAISVGLPPSEPRAPSSTRRAKSAAILAVAALLMLCFAPVWIAPYFVARYSGRDANLRGTLLPYAPLRAANLRGATLDAARLVGATLAQADLHDASLRRTHLRNADLSGASLRGVALQGADLRDANLRGADLRCSPGKDGGHRGATSLEGADLRGTDLRRALYDSHTRWPKGFHPNQNGACLIGPNAKLIGASLRGAYLVDEDLTGANLSNADLGNAEVACTSLRGANLCGADFETATLVDVELTGAYYDARTRWPAGFDPHKHGAVRVN